MSALFSDFRPISHFQLQAPLLLHLGVAGKAADGR
jgi:hypothetical protein